MHVRQLTDKNTGHKRTCSGQATYMPRPEFAGNRLTRLRTKRQPDPIHPSAVFPCYKDILHEFLADENVRQIGQRFRASLAYIRPSRVPSISP